MRIRIHTLPRINSDEVTETYIVKSVDECRGQTDKLVAEEAFRLKSVITSGSVIGEPICDACDTPLNTRNFAYHWCRKER